MRGTSRKKLTVVPPIYWRRNTYRMLNSCRIWSLGGLNTLPPPHPLPATHCLCKCTLLWHSPQWKGGEGAESWTREKVRGATVNKGGSKIPTWMTVSPAINPHKHLPQSPFLQVNIFRWQHFTLVSVLLDSQWFWWCDSSESALLY